MRLLRVPPNEEPPQAHETKHECQDDHEEAEGLILDVYSALILGYFNGR